MGLPRVAARSLRRSLPALGSAWLAALACAALAQEVPRAPLTTSWGEELLADESEVHPEYPRPQLVRPEWLNLNGWWEFALTEPGAERPEAFGQRIRVPFPVESALSGVMRPATDRGIWYRRTVEIPPAWAGRRVLLRFGAVDWEARVWVNGRAVGEHRGGYDPFAFDVTDALEPSGSQEIVVRAWDPSDAGDQPRGKQVREPGGIWYTPSSGIWQTVWLEPVPEVRIEGVRYDVDLERYLADPAAPAALRVTPEPVGDAAGMRVEAVLTAAGEEVARAAAPAGEAVELTVPAPRPWGPDDPFLYDLELRLLDGERTVDEVAGYTGLRSVALGPDANGDLRILLNGHPLFHFGVLDQGFWPDGLYTAPSDAALRSDLEAARRFGFNMVRKHVKVEPARWYHWADRLGVLVWQDMPNGGPHAPQGGGEVALDPEVAAQFELELLRVVDALEPHPSVVVWVPFNEGWGQHDSVRIAALLAARDPGRLVNAASGWNDLGAGDLVDIHRYPGPAAPETEAARAAVLGEFGGLGLPIPGLTWQDEANWGYRQFEDAGAWFEAYRALLAGTRELAERAGLAAAVYTQLTDVETEVNGLLTYDRRVPKTETPRLRQAAVRLTRPLPLRRALLSASDDPAGDGTRWRWTTEPPGAGWTEPGFDDAGWNLGPGGFGRPGARGGVVRTAWTERELWLRAAFTLEGRPGESAFVRVHHDEDIEIFLNGEPLLRLPYYTQSYVDVPLGPEARALLREGENVIAARCRRLGPGQYCDLGLYDAVTRADAEAASAAPDPSPTDPVPPDSVPTHQETP